MRNKERIIALEEKIDELEDVIKFLLKHKKDEVVVKHSDNFISWEYILGVKVIRLYEPCYCWKTDIGECKKLNENQIVYKLSNDVDNAYYLLDKVSKQVIEIPYIMEEKTSTKKVKNENKKNKTTKTTKRNKL